MDQEPIVQLTLTMDDLHELVALVTLAAMALQATDQKVPAVVDQVSNLYFALMNPEEGSNG